MSAATASDLERYMLDLVNEERISRGLNALVLDKVLNASADAHSLWMLENNIFSHTGVDGSTPTERMTAEGFDLSGSWRTAENIAAQSERGAQGLFDDVYDLHIALMNSPGHRENILMPDLEVVGIGIQTGTYRYESGTYYSVMVTQNFAMTGGQTTPDVANETSVPPADSNTSQDLTGVLVGTATVENLVGTVQRDLIEGLGGNDTLTGGLGDDLIDGGAGVDTAVYSGERSSYTVQISSTGVVITDRRPSQDGTDTLIDIENLRFADGDFDLGIRSGAAGLSTEDFAAIVELYIAYFNRAPAAQGLLYWATRLEDGMTLPEIAESFFGQPETQRTYASYLNSDGSLQDTEAFVSAVFNNVLGRDPSGPYWVNELNNNPEITPAIFILSVLNGARAASGGAGDVAYLQDKTDIGVYFSAIKGLSDFSDTISVMELYNGTRSSVSNAVSVIDEIHADALDPMSGEFLMPLVGVIDDPFAIS
ncbi:CAP domain-containing protein [Marivita geojedonensis]|uniref:CAP domain-containing protein n=1 Tax=Marivita geojedonensis TaxID=1123756 RepID=UPI000D072352|nr:CAP domain-containing protein [Marivita geojedonensis]PRY73910.1 uncharacterized protein DUF4214 [Marivita geojedonensis]